MPRRSCLEMYDDLRDEYELVHQDEGRSEGDDSRHELRASTHAFLRVLDELRREDGPTGAGN